MLNIKAVQRMWCWRAETSWLETEDVDGKCLSCVTFDTLQTHSWWCVERGFAAATTATKQPIAQHNSTTTKARFNLVELHIDASLSSFPFKSITRIEQKEFCSWPRAQKQASSFSTLLLHSWKLQSQLVTVKAYDCYYLVLNLPLRRSNSVGLWQDCISKILPNHSTPLELY